MNLQNSQNFKLISSGILYPDSAESLKITAAALADSLSTMYSDFSDPDSRTIIVPHASYEFTASLLAHAWSAAFSNFTNTHTIEKTTGQEDIKTTGQKAEETVKPEKIVILLPVHEPHPEGIEGLFIPDMEELKTLSGTISIHRPSVELILEKFADPKKQSKKSAPHPSTDTSMDTPSVSSKVYRDWVYIFEEPALELNFPFIEHFFTGVPLVPIFCGSSKSKDAKTLAAIISRIDSPDTIYVVSANLTGYELREHAQKHASMAKKWLTEHQSFRRKSPLLELFRKKELTICNPLALEALRRAEIGSPVYTELSEYTFFDDAYAAHFSSFINSKIP